jgi:hypothetical protein
MLREFFTLYYFVLSVLMFVFANRCRLVNLNHLNLNVVYN